MKSFKEYNELYENMRSSMKNFSFDSVSPQFYLIFGEVLTEMMSEVKNSENRKLILQEVVDNHGRFTIRNDLGVLRLVNMATILSGLLDKDVNETEVVEFGMKGDSGYNDLRLNMVRHVVETEQGESTIK